MHKVQLKGKEKEKKKDKEESSSKKKKIAFKRNQDSSDGSDVDINQEVANLSRKMSKLVRKNKNFRRKFSNKVSYNSEKSFDCDEPGHKVKDCPKRKEKNKKYSNFKKKEAL